MLYLAKLSFRNKGEIKTFPNEEKLNEFLTTRPTISEELTPIVLKLPKISMKEEYTQTHCKRPVIL